MTISAMTETQTKSFPPIDDAIIRFNNIDWADVRHRSKIGVNLVGTVTAFIGEQIFNLGNWLSEV